MTANTDAAPTAEYDVPVAATLHVALANGDGWPATAADLDRFGLITRTGAYRAFRHALDDTLRGGGVIEGDLTNAALNPLRELAEVAILHPDLLDHPDNLGWVEVIELERRLQRVNLIRLREIAAGLAAHGRRLDEAEHQQGPAMLGMGQELASIARELGAMAGGQE